MDANRINITICGDGGTGKSSITLRLVRSEWTNEYDPTIEDSYTVTREHDGQTYILSLTDTAGQEEYRAMQSSYALQADAFLLVYDITAPASLHEQLPHFLANIDQAAEVREARRLPPAVAIVAGNKCDLDADRRVSAEEGLKWARAHGCGFMETSAREFVNVEETFALIIRRVVEARRKGQAQKPGALAATGQARGQHAPSTSFATTAPLSPLHEKAAPPQKAPWWRRLLCCCGGQA